MYITEYAICTRYKANIAYVLKWIIVKTNLI